jgi:hypothetical protein
MPYAAALTLFDPYLVHGQRELMETCWLPALDSGSIDAFIRAMQTPVSSGCAVFTHEFKGAASRVPADATAFGLSREKLTSKRKIRAWRVSNFKVSHSWRSLRNKSSPLQPRRPRN